MQLSISPSAPSASGGTPSSVASLADAVAATGKPSASFAQLLPPTTKPGPAKAAAPTPASTTAQEEAAAAVAAGWNPVPPAPLPTVVPKVAVTGVNAAAGSPSNLSSPAQAQAAAATEAKAAATALPKAGAAASAAHAGPAGMTAPAAAAAESAAADPATARPAPAAATAAAVPVAAATPAATGAKFAAPVAKDPAPVSATKGAGVKKVQTADSNAVADASPSVGTAVAKVTSVMPSTATSERAPAPTPIPQVGSTGAAATGADTPSAPPETVSTTGAAVQAALTAAELLSSSNAAKTVNLQFNMGDADLSLRVQLLNGQVHATFSTDSAQLRSALASEWQSAAGPANAHLAAPVFTGSGAGFSSGGGSMSSGDSAPQQGGRQAPDDFSATFAVPSSPRRTSGSVAALAAVPASSPVELASSQHLQTFA